jgi:hypothetical protein
LTSLLLLSAACGASGCCLTVASDGDYGSLQGSGSFSPNAVLAVVQPADGGGDGSETAIVDLVSSTPAFICADESASTTSPDSGVLFGSVRVWVLQTGEIKPGTFNLTDPETSLEVPTDAGTAFVYLSGATSPPSTSFRSVAASVSGTVTLTKVGDEWAGSFTATMLSDIGAEQSALTGSFDTRTVCAYQGQ